MKKFTVNEKQTLKTFTDNVYPQGSFAFPRLLRARDIRVNGKKTGENILLREGDEVVYYTTLREESVPAYETVYEDENVLVADKYAGVNSEALYFALSQKGETYFIHRLDRNTAGLMIFAKNKRAEAELLRAFRERRVQKIYLALCFGKFAKGVDMLCGYLVKDEKAARVRVYSKPREGGGKDRNRILRFKRRRRTFHGGDRPAQRKDASDTRAHGVYRAPRRGGRKVRRRGAQQKIRGEAPTIGG